MIRLNRNCEYIPSQKIILIWQARAACSSVMKMYFKELNLLTNEYLEPRTRIHHLRQTHAHKESYKKKKLEALKDKNTKYIQFTVNPYRRAVSSYIHLMKTNYIKNDKENLNISFEDYINNLYNNKYKVDIHHNKQYSYLAAKNKIDYIKMEYFNKIKKKFNKKYNLNFNLIEHKAYNNNSRKNVEEIKDFIGKKKWNEIKQNYPNKYHYFYNTKIKSKVYQLYEDDFKEFKYTWKDFKTND